MNFVRTILFMLVFYPGSALCVLAAFPASLFGSRFSIVYLSRAADLNTPCANLP